MFNKSEIIRKTRAQSEKPSNNFYKLIKNNVGKLILTTIPFNSILVQDFHKRYSKFEMKIKYTKV